MEKEEEKEEKEEEEKGEEGGRIKGRRGRGAAENEGRTKALGFHVGDETDRALASPPAAGAPPQFTLFFSFLSLPLSFFLSSRLPGNRSDYSWSLRGCCSSNESLSKVQRRSFHVAEKGVEG